MNVKRQISGSIDNRSKDENELSEKEKLNRIQQWMSKQDQKIAGVAKRLNDVEEENRTLHKNNRENESLIREIRAELNKVQKVMDDLRQKEKHSADELKKAKQMIDDLEKKNNKLEAEKKEFIREIQRWKSELSNFQKQNAILSEEHDRARYVLASASSASFHASFHEDSFHKDKAIETNKSIAKTEEKATETNKLDTETEDKATETHKSDAETEDKAIGTNTSDSEIDDETTKTNKFDTGNRKSSNCVTM